jgi:hypothetical protein
VHAVHLAVAVRVEAGLDPQLLADPAVRVFERGDDLGLSVFENGTDALGESERSGRERDQNDEEVTRHG